jgi:hypothetical protein
MLGHAGSLRPPTAHTITETGRLSVDEEVNDSFTSGKWIPGLSMRGLYKQPRKVDP